MKLSKGSQRRVDRAIKLAEMSYRTPAPKAEAVRSVVLFRSSWQVRAEMRD